MHGFSSLGGGSTFGVILFVLALVAPFLMFGAALDFTSFDFALKEMYDDQQVQQIVYKKNPLFAMVGKNTDFLGDVFPQPVIFGNPQGRSASLANAITNNSSTKGTKFNLFTFEDYGVVKIDHKTMKASAGNAGAFIEARKTEIDGMLTSLGRSVSISLFRNGSGSIGQIGSGQGTPTVTLVRASDATNFEVGQVLNVSATDGGGAGIRVGTVTITGVDVDAGTVTASGNWTAGIAAAAANDFIFVMGDYDEKLKGLDGWLPSPASGVRTVTATPFFGVDRSPNPSRLAGVYYDGTGVPIEEALIELISRVSRQGGMSDYIFTSYAQFVALEKSLGSKVTYVNPNAGGSANVGFKGISISGPDGPVTVLQDINCPNAKAYALQMDTWKLRSTGKVPTLYDTDGLTMLRGTTTDDVEVRAYYYAVLGCNAPGWNGVCSLTAA